MKNNIHKHVWKISIFWGANLLFSFFRTIVFVVMKYVKSRKGYLSMNLNSLIKGFFICIWNSSTKTQVYKTLKHIKLIVLPNKFGIWEKYDLTAFLRWKISRWKNPSFILVRKFGKYQDATKSKHILINANQQIWVS